MRRTALAALAGLAAGLGFAGAAAGPLTTLALPPAMPAPERARIEEIAARAHVATRVAGAGFPTRPDVFEFLLDHPDFATRVTRTLRLARYRIWRTPGGLFLDDGWGATGHFWVLYAANGTRVMHARGQYRKGVLPSIRGEAVTILEYTYTTGADGRSLIHPTVTGFVRFHSRAVALLLAIARPLAQRKADKEAHRLVKVFKEVSEAIDRDPAGVYEKLAAQPDVPRGELEEFRQLLNVR